MFGTKDAVEAAKALIHLRRDYSNPPKSERGLDPILYGYLTAAHSNVRVSRQHNVRFAGATKPGRIDFRIGGANPALLELAVRPSDGQQELCGPQNLKELIKLSKSGKVKRRILLLIDLKKRSIHKDDLKPAYDALNAGRGRKPRHPVTVVYVHSENSYYFTWKPFRSA